jgi:formylglycine-generating enzyme required for sulfatase activity
MPHSLPASRCLAFVVVSSLVAGVALLGPGLAQTEKGKKYALLVGVRSYDHDSLPDLKHTENDVEEVGKVLARAGYRVTLLTTTRGKTKNNALPTAKNIRTELKGILDKVTKHDTVLVALAGHGVQLRVKAAGGEKEEGFFCPADAKPRSTKDATELGKTMIPLTALFQELEDSGAGVKLLLVDACRNDPKAGRNVDVDSLPRPPKGTAALFSCKSGERAFETDKLGKGHGVFFFHVLEALRGKAKDEKGEVTWTRLAEYVTNKVSDEVPVLIGGGAKQTPHEIKNLTGKSPVLIASLGGEVAREKTNEKPGKEKAVKDKDKEITNSIGMKLVRIPKGTFTMGSTAWEYRQGMDEKGHTVEVTKDFYLGIHEVTQAQYQKVMGTNPSYFSSDGDGKKKRIDSDDFPVESVSWQEAVAFCKKLSDRAEEKRAGRAYRLPTEAEWEYSCRGGGSPLKPFHVGKTLSSKQANFDGIFPYMADRGVSLRRTCKVGSYAKNAFGLYDMHGNVWEWCADWYDKDYYRKSPNRDPQGPSEGSHRVIRGGGWSSVGWGCRSACRSHCGPDSRLNYVGFRAAHTPLEE